MDLPLVYQYQLTEEQFSSLLNLALPRFRFASRDGKKEFLSYGTFETFSTLDEVKTKLSLLKTHVPETREQLCAFVISPYSNLNRIHKNVWFLPKVQIHRGEESIAFVLNDQRSLEEIILNFNSPTSNLFSTQENIESLVPNFDKWCDQIQLIQQAISQKQFAKVVLSRQEYFTSPTVQVSTFFDRMKRNTDQCYKIQFRTNDDIFFSVTPECLLYVKGDEVWIDSLAGSHPILEDTHSTEHITNLLLQSSKEQSEHDIVKNSIYDTLRPYLQINAEIQESKSVKKLGYIQHLYTSLYSHLDSKISLQQLIEDLHPTPAICGFPKHKSIAFLEQIDEPERGYYGGFAGWCNQNELELAVLIRSALLSSNGVTIYGGAGIVEESNAESEWKETELKMSIMKQIILETHTNELH